MTLASLFTELSPALRVTARMGLWHLLGSCSPPEAQIKCTAMLRTMCHGALVSGKRDPTLLPPLHPTTFPGTCVPQSSLPPQPPMLGDLQDKPGLTPPLCSLPHVCNIPFDLQWLAALRIDLKRE